MSDIRIPINVPVNGLQDLNKLKESLSGTKKAADDLGNSFASLGDKGDISSLRDSFKGFFDQLTKFKSETADLVSGLSATAEGGAAAGVSMVGMAAAIGTVAAGVGVAAVAINSLVSEFGKVAEKTQNTADRLGLTTGQVEKLSAMAEIAGVNINTLESAGRLLADGLEKGANSGNKTAVALQKMGIYSVDLNGNLQEVGRTVLEVLQHLATIPSQAERLKLANETLGRSAKELLPLIKNYDDLRTAVEAMGVGLDENGTKKLTEADDAADKLNITIRELKKTLAGKFAPIVIQFAGIATDILNGKTPFAAKGGSQGQFSRPEDLFGGGPGKTSTPAEEAAKAAAEATKIQQQAELDAMKSKADAATKWFANTAEGMTQRIKTLKEEAQKLQSELYGGAPLKDEVRSREQAKYDSTEAQIKNLEARLKSIKELPEFLKQAQKALADAQASELEGVDKINAKRAEELKLHGQTAQLQDLINQRFDIEVNNELKKEAIAKRRLDLNYQLKAIADEFKDDPKAAADATSDAKIRAAITDFETSKKVNELQKQITQAVHERSLAYNKISENEEKLAQKAADTALQRGTEYQLHSIGLGGKSDDKADGQIEERLRIRLESANALSAKNAQERAAKQDAIDKAYFDRDMERLDLKIKRQEAADQRRLQQLQAQANYEARVIELTAKPGHEVESYAAIANKRIELAKKEYDITHDRAKFENEVEDALYDKQVKRLELQKKQLDEYKDAAGKVFDALTSKGSTGILDLVHGQLQTMERKVFQNIAGKVFEKAGGLGLPNLSGKLGGIFDGIPGFGTPPFLKSTAKPGDIQKQAKEITDTYAGPTKENTAATDKNTAALDRLTKALQQTSGGSGSGPGGGGGGSFNPITGAFTIPPFTGAKASSSVPAGEVSTTITGDDGSLIGSGSQIYAGSAGSSGSGGAGGKSGGGISAGQAASAAAGIGAGAIGVYGGVKQGGAKGAAHAVASGAMAIAPFTGPAAPFILAGAMALDFVGQFFGPNREKRNAEIDQEIRGAQWFDRPTIYRNIDTTGANVDFDARGRSRTGAPTEMRIHISALDAKNILERGDDIAEALKYQIIRGHTVIDEIRQKVA